jgi:hypothetical protein
MEDIDENGKQRRSDMQAISDPTAKSVRWQLQVVVNLNEGQPRKANGRSGEEQDFSQSDGSSIGSAAGSPPVRDPEKEKWKDENDTAEYVEKNDPQGHDRGVVLPPDTLKRPDRQHVDAGRTEESETDKEQGEERLEFRA